jgi:putative thioredoxin
MTDPAKAWTFDVDQQDFPRAVIERSYELPVVVDFWAEWCHPCRMLGPVLERLVAERRGEVVLAKVNVDQAQALAARYGVEAIPAVKAFRNGQPVLEFEGVLPEDQLRLFLDRISPTEADRLLDQARAQEANPAEAEALYRKAVQSDPRSPEPRVGLARVLLAEGKPDEVPDLLDPVGSEGDVGAEAQRLLGVARLRLLAKPFGDEAAARRRLEADPRSAEGQYRLGVILAAVGRYPEALPLLLSAGQRDAKMASSLVREAMVQVFYALGVGHPLADEYRARLTQLLY